LNPDKGEVDRFRWYWKCADKDELDQRIKDHLDKCSGKLPTKRDSK